MKVEPILLELEAVKERLAAEAGGDSRLFLDQMEAWTGKHLHAGPVVNSPEELQARLRVREATELPAAKRKPYRVHDPIIAELHRTREKLYREGKTDPLILKDEPPRKKR